MLMISGILLWHAAKSEKKPSRKFTRVKDSKLREILWHMQVRGR